MADLAPLCPQSGEIAGVSVQPSNVTTSSLPSISWRSGTFSLKAIPLGWAQNSVKMYDTHSSPYPLDVGRVTKHDTGRTSSALDHIALRNVNISKTDKIALKLEQHNKSSYRMKLNIIVTKRKVHKLAVVRSRIRKKIHAAIRKVAQPVMSARAEDAVLGTAMHRRHIRDYVLPGYRYTCLTSLELYAMPLAKLVILVERALREIHVSPVSAHSDAKY